VASRTLDIGYGMLVVAIEALDHPGQDFDRCYLGKLYPAMAALTRHVGIDVLLVREHGAVRFDARHLLRIRQITVTRGTLILVVHIVTIGTDVHCRKKVVRPHLTFRHATVTVGTLQFLILNVQPVREDEFDLIVIRWQARNGLIPDQSKRAEQDGNHQNQFRQAPEW
jgi:hypothetical protein